jgi:hypothetical protein
MPCKIGPREKPADRIGGNKPDGLPLLPGGSPGVMVFVCPGFPFSGVLFDDRTANTSKPLRR